LLFEAIFGVVLLMLRLANDVLKGDVREGKLALFGPKEKVPEEVAVAGILASNYYLIH